MAERKVLVKYYPPDFDPRYLKGVKKTKDTQFNVRNMLAFTLRCNQCGAYCGIGTKYNMRVEICLDETYLGMRIYRFYFRCPQCKSEITFKTDPKNDDYIVEHGATRNYDAQRDMDAAENVLKQMRENDEEGNAMAFLENKTHDSKREIEINDALEEIRHMSKRQVKFQPDQLLRQLLLYDVDQNQMDEEEQLQLELVKNNTQVKRIRQFSDDEEDDYCGDKVAEKIKDLNKKNDVAGAVHEFGLTNIGRKEKQETKKYRTVIKKIQVVEQKNENGENINLENKKQPINNSNNDEISKINNNNPQKQQQQLNLLGYSSDSD